MIAPQKCDGNFIATDNQCRAIVFAVCADVCKFSDTKSLIVLFRWNPRWWCDSWRKHSILNTFDPVISGPELPVCWAASSRARVCFIVDSLTSELWLLWFLENGMTLCCPCVFETQSQAKRKETQCRFNGGGNQRSFVVSLFVHLQEPNAWRLITNLTLFCMLSTQSIQWKCPQNGLLCCW